MVRRLERWRRYPGYFTFVGRGESNRYEAIVGEHDSTRSNRGGRTGPPGRIYVVAGVAIGFVVLTLSAALLWAGGQQLSTATRDPYAQLRLFGEVFEKVSDDYVDKPDEAKLVHTAIKGMLASLDPHSGYVDGDALRAMVSITRGEIGDVGLEFAELRGALTVVSPIDGTSAARAGVLPGDVIVRIDGVSTQDLMLDEAAERLRGPVNSMVRLTIRRGSDDTSEHISIMRDIVRVKPVRFHLEAGDIGYIRIAQFTEMTASSLREAMAELRGEIPDDAFRGYVLDLRNNPGGYVDQAIKTVNAFVKEGEIVSTRGRAPGSDRRFDAQPGADLSRGAPLVVLINGGTASAAEIVAGALKDLKRATLVGTRSFGKGTVQTTLPLGSGALRLTTARYFTPSGRSIQAEGIEPDKEVLEEVPPALQSQAESAGEASLDRHLANPGGERLHTSQAYVPPDPKDDKQMAAAIELLHGIARSPDSQSPSERQVDGAPVAPL
jgi:carboxyl-terminal processing protease